MFGFGKRKKEEEEEIKVKDLKPVNKRTRKEPVKPWGRFERVLILTVLGLTIAISAVLGAVAKGGLEIPKVSLPEVAKNNFSLSQTFVFEKKSPGDCCEKPVLEFKSLTSDLTGTYGFYLIRLDGSAEYGSNEDETFKAASLIKLPTIVALYQIAEAGEINLDSKYVLKESDKWPGNGSLFNAPAGSQYTFRQLAKYALKDSDNTAFNILEIYLGDRKIQEAIAAMGLIQTSIYDNTTSVKDMAILFEKIKEARIMTPENSDEALSYMKNTSFDSWLKAGISDGVDIAHKYGRESGVVNDAGIIYGPNPYILVILSKDVDGGEADKVIPKISKVIYDFETRR